MSVVALSGLAALLLYQALEARGEDESHTFRLRSSNGGFWIVPGTVCERDCVALFRGRTVLVVDPAEKEALGTCRLEAQVEEQMSVIYLKTEARHSCESASVLVWRSGEV